jgi:hypothetical protein
MALLSVPTPHPGWGFFSACQAFHPLDHQAMVTQTLTVTHRARPAVDHGAHVFTCAHRG